MSPGIKVFLTLTVITALYAGSQGQGLAVFASMLIITAVVLAYLWNQYAFSRLTVERRISRRRVELGQEVQYELDITNDKVLPLLWLRIQDRVPDHAQFVRAKVIRKVLGSSFFLFNDVFSLRWYQRATRRYAFIPTHRGYYEFGPATMYHAGAFGLFENTSQELLDSADLIVYPKILPLRDMGLDYQQLFGRRPRDGWIHTDPLNIMGVRPYQTSDSMKAINWKASARHQQLESNVEKPSLDDEIHIFLQAVAPGAWWELAEQNAVEISLIAAASLVDAAGRQGRRVGLYSNLAQKKSGSVQGTVLRPGALKDQRTRLLTALALMQSYSIGKLEAIMQRQKQAIPAGSRVLLICSEPSDTLRRSLMDYQRCYQLTVIQLGPKERDLPGVHRIVLDREVPWHERTSLETA